MRCLTACFGSSTVSKNEFGSATPQSKVLNGYETRCTSKPNCSELTGQTWDWEALVPLLTGDTAQGDWWDILQSATAALTERLPADHASIYLVAGAGVAALSVSGVPLFGARLGQLLLPGGCQPSCCSSDDDATPTHWATGATEAPQRPAVDLTALAAALQDQTVPVPVLVHTERQSPTSQPQQQPQPLTTHSLAPPGQSALVGKPKPLPKQQQQPQQPHQAAGQAAPPRRHFLAVGIPGGKALAGMLLLSVRGPSTPPAWQQLSGPRTLAALLSPLLRPAQVPLARRCLAELLAAATINELVRALHGAAAELLTMAVRVGLTPRVALLRNDGTTAAVFSVAADPCGGGGTTVSQRRSKDVVLVDAGGSGYLPASRPQDFFMTTQPPSERDSLGPNHGTAAAMYGTGAGPGAGTGPGTGTGFKGLTGGESSLPRGFIAAGTASATTASCGVSSGAAGCRGQSLPLQNTLLSEALTRGSGLCISDCNAYVQDSKAYPRDLVLFKGAAPPQSLALATSCHCGRPLLALYATYHSILPQGLLQAVVQELGQLLRALTPTVASLLLLPGGSMSAEWSYLHDHLLAPSTPHAPGHGRQQRLSSNAGAAAINGNNGNNGNNWSNGTGAAAGAGQGGGAAGGGEAGGSPRTPLMSPATPTTPAATTVQRDSPPRSPASPSYSEPGDGTAAAAPAAAGRAVTVTGGSHLNSRLAGTAGPPAVTAAGTASSQCRSADGGTAAPGGILSTVGAMLRRATGAGGPPPAPQQQPPVAARSVTSAGGGGPMPACPAPPGVAPRGLTAAVAAPPSDSPWAVPTDALTAAAAAVAAAAGGNGCGTTVHRPLTPDTGERLAAFVSGGETAAATAAAAAAAATGGGGVGVGVGPASVTPLSALSGVARAGSAAAAAVASALTGRTSFSLEAAGSPRGGVRLAPLITTLHDRLKSAQAEQLTASSRAASRLLDLESLRFLERVGKGGYGSVYRGLYHGGEVAIKVVEDPASSLTRLSESLTGSGAGGSTTLRAKHLHDAIELVASVSMSHPNIVQLITYFVDVRAHQVALRTATVASTNGDNGDNGVAGACCNSGGGGGGGEGADGDGDPDLYDMDVPPVQLVHMTSSGLDSTASSFTEPEGNEAIVLVMEYCDRGSLKDAIQDGSFLNLDAISRMQQQQRRQQQQQPGQQQAGQGQQQQAGQGQQPAGQPPALRNSAALLNMKSVYSTLLEVALALRHMHGLHMVHCDLKPQNVLLKSSPRDPRGFTAKLSDFGLAKMMAHDEEGQLVIDESIQSGTITHLPPEALQGRRQLGPAVDVYAFGIVMYQVLCGMAVYRGMEIKQMIRGVVRHALRPSFPAWVPTEYRELAQRCWHESSSLRPSALQLVAELEALLDGCDGAAAGQHGRRGGGLGAAGGAGGGAASSAATRGRKLPQKCATETAIRSQGRAGPAAGPAAGAAAAGAARVATPGSVAGPSCGPEPANGTAAAAAVPAAVTAAARVQPPPYYLYQVPGQLYQPNGGGGGTCGDGRMGPLLLRHGSTTGACPGVLQPPALEVAAASTAGAITPGGGGGGGPVRVASVTAAAASLVVVPQRAGLPGAQQQQPHPQQQQQQRRLQQYHHPQQRPPQQQQQQQRSSLYTRTGPGVLPTAPTAAAAAPTAAAAAGALATA